MSGRDPAHRQAAPRSDTSALRTIAAPASAFVSPRAVRRAVAGYAAEQGWGPGMTAGAVREGVAVALAAAGLVTQMPPAAGADPWARTVPTTYGALQELTGLDAADVRSALEVLASAGVLRSGQDDGGLTITLSAEGLWAPHPLLARAPWPLLSVALTRAEAPVRAGLVVFAELALETETAWRAQAPVGSEVATRGGDAGLPTAPPNVWLELTLKELAHRVSYHLSHVENALAGLEAAGCLTRLRGSSRRAMRLAPWTVGAEPPPASLLRSAAPADTAPSAVDTSPTSAPAAAAGDGVVVEFQGVRAVLAPGDVLDVSQRDASGRRVLCIRTDDGDVIIRPAPHRTS